MCALYNRDRARDGREDDDKRPASREQRKASRRDAGGDNEQPCCCMRRLYGHATLIARIIIPRNDNYVANDRRCLRTMETASYKHIASFSLQH
jgi:hypothetical protein